MGLRLQQNDKLIFDYFKGPVQENTLLPISSLSKQFLSAAFVLNQNRIKLNQKVGELIRCPDNYSSITVSDLLDHTSGVPEYLYTPREEDLEKWSLQECVQYIFSQPPEARKFKYSNSNYVILSSIIQENLNCSYSQFIKDEILNKSKMIETVSIEDLFNKLVVFPELYSQQNGKWGIVKPSRANFGWGDSGFFSTVRDFSNWLNSFCFKEFIEKIKDGSQKEYTRGLFSNKLDCYFHTGSTIGGESFMAYWPKENISLVYLSNYTAPKESEVIPRLISLVNFIH